MSVTYTSDIPDNVAYYDPLTKNKDALQINGDPSVFGDNGIAVSNGRWGLSHALSDPNSAVSGMSYYGGTKNGATDEYWRQKQQANDLANRDEVQGDFTNADQSAGYQNSVLSGLGQAVAGDPNSVAQHQLSSTYDTANAQAFSGANSARGGAAAHALAQRTAHNQVAANAGAQAIAGQKLMNQEQIGAMGQMSGLSGAMRTQDATQAAGQADLSMASRTLNDQAMQAANQRALNAAKLGMQGGANHQAMRQEALQSGLGADSAETAAANARNEQNLNQVMGTVSGAAGAVGNIIQNMPKKKDDDPAGTATGAATGAMKGAMGGI